MKGYYGLNGVTRCQILSPSRKKIVKGRYCFPLYLAPSGALENQVSQACGANK